MKRLFLFLGLLAALPAAETGQYIAFHAATLSSSTDAVTVQQPASGKQRRNVRLTSAWVYCSVACTFTPSQNCTTPATTTTLATTPVNTSPPSTAVAFSASNASGCVSWPAYNVPAGGTFTIELSTVMLTGSQGSNFTISIASMTGSSQISIGWIEQ